MAREWTPELHPRGHGGKFARKGGAVGSAAAALATAEKARKAGSGTSSKRKKPAPAAEFRRFSGQLLAPEPKPATPKRLRLSKEERRALHLYTGNEYVAMNDYLTNGRQVPGYAREDREYVEHVSSNVAALEHLINRSPLPASLTVTRGIHAPAAERVFGPVGSRSGHVMTEHRFASTTKDSTPPLGFGNVMLRYSLKRGVRALDVNTTGDGVLYENEVIIGPGQRFRVTSDRMERRGRVIELESV